MSWMEYRAQALALPSAPCHSMINLHIQLATQHDTRFFSIQYHNYCMLLMTPIYVITYVLIITSDFHDTCHIALVCSYSFMDITIHKHICELQCEYTHTHKYIIYMYIIYHFVWATSKPRAVVYS